MTDRGERSAPGRRTAVGRLRDLVAILLVVGGLLVAGSGAWDWYAARDGGGAATVPTATPAPGGAVRETAVELPEARPGRARPGRPLRVRVPALGVDAPVDPVQAPGGTLTPPSDPTRLGWWSDGARPGDRGSVLVAGHTVSAGGGALDDLEQLEAGDEVVVRTTRGPRRYEVTTVQVLGKGVLAARAPRLFDQSVPGRLVLVTCEDWDGTAYRSNVVVTAVPPA